MKGGQWCPQCKEGISERMCRIFFETVFRKKFQRIRPSWLMNNNQNKMELDGYNEDLKIAFEYNGEQHYKKIKKYNQTDLDLKQRKLDDRMKSEICLVKGIKLVVIPPFKQTDNED